MDKHSLLVGLDLGEKVTQLSCGWQRKESRRGAGIRNPDGIGGDSLHWGMALSGG